MPPNLQDPPDLKRKRSLEESVVDVSQVKSVFKWFDTLKAELARIGEAEGPLQQILAQAPVFEDILKGVKKRKVTFSNVTSEDLSNAGVEEKDLDFNFDKVTELAKVLESEARNEIADLNSRINKIYEHVNMDSEPGSRMILDAILLTLAQITSDEQRSVAILPEVKIDGAQIKHPTSGYELWLSGSIDYAVVEYDNKKNYKKRVVGLGGAKKLPFHLINGRLLLVEAKRQGLAEFLSNVPEAVSQAMALLHTAKYLTLSALLHHLSVTHRLSEVRFCLSDGQNWMFFVLKSENGVLTYYKSVPWRLSEEKLQISPVVLQEIIQLVREWLRPTVTDLFALQA